MADSRHACLEWTELDEIAALSPEDPRAREYHDCPSCRALLASHAKFESPEGLLDRPDYASERQRLEEFLQTEIAGEAESTSAVARRPAVEERPSVTEWLRRCLRPRVLAPSLGFATVVVLVILGPRAWDRSPETDGIDVLRGPASETTGLTLESSVSEGEVSLHWSRVEGADRYVVVFSNADLEELHRIDTGDEFRFTEQAGAFLDRLGTTRDETIFWRVVATTGSREIERSQLRVLFEP